VKPLLLLDIDGVIRVFGPVPPAAALQGSPDLLIRLETPALIGRLSERFDLVWATSWEHEANKVVSPLLGLQPLPVIEFEGVEVAPGESFKLPRIKRCVGSRPFAWVDDEIGKDCHDWARARPEPTLLLEIDPRAGIGEEDVEELLEFSARIEPARGG